MMEVRREIVRPGAGAPHWIPEGGNPGGLCYLGWGRRQYGREPIPLRFHDGWTYVLVTAGNPVLLAGRRRLRTAPGTLLVVGPDLCYGWSDRGDAVCSALTWVWTRGPGSGWPPNGLRRAVASAEAADLIGRLHADARAELQRPDSRTDRVLSAQHCLLDAAVERAGEPERSTEDRDGQRLRLAASWMRRHPDARAPAAALADYLGLSQATLVRLFRVRAGRSPAEAFREMRMREARRRLALPGASVKAVGLGLGYRNAGDFSRAYLRFFGCRPSEEAAPPGPPPENRAAHGSRERGSAAR